jgi:hypothetical protein
MTELAQAIRHVPMPLHVDYLAVSDRGFPVPWFVAWVDGKPDFRVADERKLALAMRQRRCWICGHRLGRLGTSVVGPMCAINRISSEPQSHLSCARYAVQACPFLTQPRARRNEKNLPGDAVEPAGAAILTNPGVSVLWSSLRASKPFEPPGGGVLFNLGSLHAIEWWARGRPATRAQCEAALEAGLPALRKLANDEGREASVEFAQATLRVLALLPPE